jgi:carboxypeptidase family protein
MGTIYGMAWHEGKPAEGVQVKLVGPGGDVAGEARTIEDGSFKFDVSPGTWTVHWTALGGETEEGQVEVPEGEDAEVELEV